MVYYKFVLSLRFFSLTTYCEFEIMKNYKTKRTKLFSRNNMRYDWKQIHEKLSQK